MRYLHLGLFGRLFSLFALTTILLVTFISLGMFNLSEDEAKAYLANNQIFFTETLKSIARDPLNTSKLTQDAKENRVELLVVKNGERWTTSSQFPEIDQLTSGAETFGELHFAKIEGKYYLAVQHEDNFSAVTSKIMNFIIYPNSLVHWPWLAVLLILLASYGILRSLLKPIDWAIQSAERLSRGELDYQIEKHPRTELAILTRSLDLMARNLHGLFSAQNDLLLAISHELRSPLARMKVSLAMLEPSDSVADLGRDIEHMDDLIAQLLEGERLKQGHAILDLTTFYLPKLIDDLLAEPSIHERVKLVKSVPELAAKVDVGRIMFALRNLIRNAIEHSSEATPVEMDITEHDNQVVIQVRDSGPGIPDDLLERVFEPFFRVESIENRSFNGVGLGLFLCKRIVEAHQGELKAANHPEGGCVLTMVLPKL